MARAKPSPALPSGPIQARSTRPTEPAAVRRRATPLPPLSPEVVAGRFRVAAALVNLDDFIVEAVTVPGRATLGLPVAAIVGQSILDLIDPAERDHARLAFDAIRSGAIDFYRADRARLTVGGGPGTVWARKLVLDGRPVVLAAWFGAGARRERPVRAANGRLLGLTIAAGIADRDGIVRSVSVDEPERSHLSADALIGRKVCTPDQEREIATLRRASPTQARLSVAYPIELPALRGASGHLVCVLMGLAGTDDLLFLILALPATDGSREAELEAHLWRIAAEVEASGVLMQVGRSQALGLGRSKVAASLSPRQWDVLRRLVNGERVPTIAADLYLSPSTVRGHLSAIFERFGVHGQAELLALLARNDDAGTSVLSG